MNVEMKLYVLFFFKVDKIKDKLLNRKKRRKGEKFS